MSEPKRRKKYTEEFKTEAVRLVREMKRPVAQVARELGISANLLRKVPRQLDTSEVEL